MHTTSKFFDWLLKEKRKLKTFCNQVHGIAWDTIKFVEKIITTEMNSATDNPLVFTNTNDIISGGNFHGEYPAKVNT